MEARVQSAPAKSVIPGHTPNDALRSRTRGDLAAVSLSRTELIGVARAERDGLGRTIQFAPPGCWEAPSAYPGWWNRDVMAHLASQDYSAAQLLVGERAEELEDYREAHPDEPFSNADYNRLIVNRRSGLPYREVLTQWGRAADLLLEAAADISDDEWRGRAVRWRSDAIGIPYLIQSRVVEWWLHGDDIRLGAGMGLRVQHWPIYLTNDLAIRMLPWSFTREGVSGAGKTIRIDLEGAGGGSWHRSLGAADVPDEGSTADAFIEGRALAFAKIAGRRAPADEALDEGTLVTGGDEILCEAVLELLRAYP
jgi:uncharacterized protein (TIGR03083 family)